MKKFSLILLLGLFITPFISQGQNHASLTTGVREYDFQNTLAEKKQNQPTLVPLDTMGVYVLDTLNEINHLTRIVYRFRKGAGLQFNNTQAGNFLGETYSIEMYFVLDTLLPTWKRVVDWKNRKSDYGAYIYFGKLNFYPYVYSDTAFVSPREYTYFVVTRDSTTQNVSIFTDTKKGISFTDTYKDAVLDADNVLNFFQDDMVVPNETSAGAISLLNIYNYVLDSVAIVQHFNNLQGQIFSVGNHNGKEIFRVYPNPATDNLFIETRSFGFRDPVSISLLDMTGTIVFSESYSPGKKITINLAMLNLSGGIYLVKAESGSEIYTKKIIVGR